MKILVYDDNGVTPVGFLQNVSISGNLRLLSVDGLVALGGSNNNSQGHGAPVAVPSDTTGSAFYTDLDTGVIYSWSVEGQAWL